MDVLETVFGALSDILEGLVNIIIETFSKVTGLWYTPPTGSNTSGSLTLLGVFSLIAFVMGVIWLAIRFIGSMISLKTAR